MLFENTNSLSSSLCLHEGDDLLDVSEDLPFVDDLFSSIGEDSMSFSVENLESDILCIVDALSGNNQETDGTPFKCGSISKIIQEELADTSFQSAFDAFDRHEDVGLLSMPIINEPVKSSNLSRKSKVNLDKVEEGIEFVEPKSKDVLLGRGHGPSKHVGNQAFRHVVCKHRASYTTLQKYKKGSEKHSKKFMAKNIHRAWTAASGRFLKMVVYEGEQRWAVADTKQATKKIGMALRQKETWQMVEASAEAKLISAEVDSFLRLLEN